MGLPLPNPAGSVSPESGPQYALDQNQAFSIVDSHNHSAGSGVQITPPGLDINTDLPFGGNSATNIYGVRFQGPNPSSQTTFLYTNAQGGGGVTDLFFNDGAGNIIPITKAGTVNSTAASIPGESYSGGTFTWVQGAGSTVPANFDIGSITIRPNTASTTNGVVLGPPSGISSQYNVQLPLVPGSATGIMQLDTSGNMLSSLVPDASTIVIASQVLKVPAGGIGSTQIASGAVGTTQIANNAVTAAKVSGNVLPGQGIPTVFTTSGTFTTPANVTYLYLVGCGGGGAGGGGAGGDNTTGAGAGAGGGSGAQVNAAVVPVTPSTMYTVTIGSGGGGGGGGANGSGSGGGSGGVGNVGTATTFGSLMSFGGGAGGGPGVATSSPGGGGGAPRGTYNGTQGSNGATGGAGSGGTGYLTSTSYSGNGGSGGAGQSSGATSGGGGGGGGSVGTGGNGGVGGTGPTSGAANTGAGGGGGGGGARPVDGGTGGQTGGNGGSGYLIVYIL